MYADHTMLQIVGQVMMGAFFIFHGVKNVSKWQFNMERTTALGLPLPPALVLVGGFIIQFTGATMVLFDIFTRIGVVLLFLFSVFATAMFHRYWSMTDEVRAEYHFLLLTYNVYVVAALFLIM